MEYISCHDNGSVTVFSGLPEFGYELISSLPYAYNLHMQGKLRATISGKDTSCLYYFSPNHTEIDEKRSYSNVKKMMIAGFPNISIHKSSLDWESFSPPNIKGFYSSSAITFEKPTVVICNRINDEWNGEPINFIDYETLESLFSLLKDKYQVIYIDTAHFGVDYEDHVSFINTPEYENIAKYDVLTLHDLMRIYPGSTINEIQCRVYSGCEKFISSNGGLGIFCSYFGGENIIFSKICHEHNPDVNSFNLWYQEFSKSTITVIRNELDLINTVKDRWVLGFPLFNILIRTSGRPNYFHDCIKSIYDQSYPYYNIIVGIDSEETFSYVKNHKCSVIRLKKIIFPALQKPEGDEYGIWFPYNIYFNKLLEYANQGFVIYLDDDDSFSDHLSLKKLADQIMANVFDLIFWRVKFPSRLVPGDDNWMKRVPVCRDMSTIGYAHNVNLRPTWEPWKRGDYRIAKYLYTEAGNMLWLDEVLTKIQRVTEDGYGKCDDKPVLSRSTSRPLCFFIYAYKAAQYLKECIDSILSENIQKNLSFRVVVGVDACEETFKFSKLLTRRYAQKVEIYYTDDYVGVYSMMASLLKKISRRDSIVVFLDSKNIFPPGVIKSYYYYYSLLIDKAVNNKILQMKTHDISSSVMKKVFDRKIDVEDNREDSLLSAIRDKKDEEAVVMAISLILKKQYESKTFSAILDSIIRLGVLRGNNGLRYFAKQNFLSLESGVFMLEYELGLSFLIDSYKKISHGNDLLSNLNICNIILNEKEVYPAIIRIVKESKNKSNVYIKDITKKGNEFSRIFLHPVL